MKCFHCGSNRLRISRLRQFDFVRLLRLQLPVRCHACMDRMYVGLFAAWNMDAARKTAIKGRSSEKI